MITTIRNRTCSLKNLAYSMIKVTQPIRYESQISTRYPDYQMFYKFPLVRVASIVNRLKLYQTVATGIGISATTILAAFDIIEVETAITCTVIGFVTCSTLYSIGFLGQNRVGYMYLKNDKNSVKISYADFWGRRVDTDIDISDIWALNDLPNTIVDSLYYSVRRHSTNKSLKFNIKHAEIVDPEKFHLVFGNPALILKR